MRRWLVVVLLLGLAAIRFSSVAYQSLTLSVGDFYSTLPGAYVEKFNPTLWNSPDFLDEVGKRPSYRRGPTQLLTTLPLSFLNSYKEISRVLLFVYAGLILASAYCMWRSFSASRNRELLGLVISSSLIFYPTLLAYNAREFEVVMLFATVMLFAAARAKREWAIGAWTAYLSLFKYLPLGLLPLLVARRWWKALGGFVITVVVLLAAAHAMFGLQNFSSDGFLGNFISHLLPGQTDNFCQAYQGWHYESNQHEVSIRFALCSMYESTPALPIVPIYLTLIIATLAALATCYFRAERAALPDDAQRWRSTWELSAVLIIYTTYVYAHYYFLIFMIVPLTAVMVRAYEQRRIGLWVAWGTSYVLLSGFLLPLSLTSRLLGVDAFTLYLRTFAYLPGILLLLGTVLHEYITVSTPSASRSVPSAAARPA